MFSTFKNFFNGRSPVKPILGRSPVKPLSPESLFGPEKLLVESIAHSEWGLICGASA